jgi:hypothetical protein
MTLKYNAEPLPHSTQPYGEPPYFPHLWNKGKNPNIRASHNCYTYMLNDLFHVPRPYGKPQPGYFIDNLENLRKEGLLNSNRLSCSKVRQGVSKDNPHMKVLSIKKGMSSRSPPHHYKGIMILSPGNDYHFARQDNRFIPIFRMLNSDIKNNHIKLSTAMPRATVAKAFIKYADKYIPEIVLLAHRTFPDLMFSKNPIDKLKAIYQCSFTWSHKPGATDVTDRDADGELIINPLAANWDYSKKGGINYNVHCCFFHVPANYHSNTFSGGISSKSQPRNNHKHMRSNLSSVQKIDSKFNHLIRYAIGLSNS